MRGIQELLKNIKELTIQQMSDLFTQLKNEGYSLKEIEELIFK